MKKIIISCVIGVVSGLTDLSGLRVADPQNLPIGIIILMPNRHFLFRTAKETSMCAKEPMAADGIVRLSNVEVYPQHLDEYMKYATEVGEVSLRIEPGVLTMYAVSEKENPCKITILETYASREAYEKHIASGHFQKYKQGTLKMVKTLELVDQNQLTESNQLINYIK